MPCFNAVQPWYVVTWAKIDIAGLHKYNLVGMQITTAAPEVLLVTNHGWVAKSQHKGSTVAWTFQHPGIRAGWTELTTVCALTDPAVPA